jgi:hypothetical protein
VQGKADYQHGREGDLPGRRGHPDRESLGEVVQSDRRRDRQAGTERFAVNRELGGERDSGLLRGAGDGWPRARAKSSLHPCQPHGAEREAGGHQGEQSDHLAPGPAVAVGELLHRLLDDREAVLEHVNEQEGQDADGEHRERYASAGVEAADPREGQAEVDCRARDGPEQDGLAEVHRAGTL